MQAWFGRHLYEVCDGLASGRLQHWLGRQQGDRVLFCFESRLLQGTVLRRRMGNGIPSCKDTTGLGFSNQTIFSTALFATPLSLGGFFVNGGGDGELQFCFYK